MSLAAALLSALAVAGDPCLVADEAGRPVVACFDPGNRLELAAGARTADQGPGEGGALELSAAWRWRGDTRDQSGAVSWRRDQLVLDAAAALRGGRVTGARALAWRGAFVRRLAEPFILLPGPRPVRLPFPFDVGMLVEAGGVRWERAREREAEVRLLRSTLLLDLARHLPGVRRAGFGPELAYDLWLSRDAAPVHLLVPFTGGALDLAAESADGLWVATLAARAGAALRVPGGFAGYASAALGLERVVLAVNDRPIALALWLGGERGATGRGPARVEAALLLRVAQPR
ncbi:MAG: hypothetical protein IPO09_13930 [Anaeromyxobacter sp.]|nr:hypothetical protein [Anaeromyxobacter sp.]MBL0275286.1 hypothetical protein [Anaeromyxobacter sp.]